MNAATRDALYDGWRRRWRVALACQRVDIPGEHWQRRARDGDPGSDVVPVLTDACVCFHVSANVTTWVPFPTLRSAGMTRR